MKKQFIPTTIIAIVFIIVVAYFYNSSIETNRYIIPFGQEEIIQSSLKPVNNVFQKAVSLDSMNISGGTIALEFTDNDSKLSATVTLKQIDSNFHNCTTLDTLRICYNKANLPLWTNKYHAWLLSDNKIVNLSGIWKKVESVENSDYSTSLIWLATFSLLLIFSVLFLFFNQKLKIFQISPLTLLLLYLTQITLFILSYEYLVKFHVIFILILLGLWFASIIYFQNSSKQTLVCRIVHASLVLQTLYGTFSQAYNPLLEKYSFKYWAIVVSILIIFSNTRKFSITNYISKIAFLAISILAVARWFNYLDNKQVFLVIIVWSIFFSFYSIWQFFKQYNLQAGRWLKGFLHSGLIEFLLISFLAVAMLVSDQSGTLKQYISSLASSKSSGFNLINSLHWSLLLVTVAVATISCIKNNSSIKSLLPAFVLTAIILSLHGLSVWTTPELFNPIFVWSELDQTVEFVAGITPKNVHYMNGSGFLSSLFIKVTGFSTLSLHLLFLACLVFWGWSVILLSYHISRSKASAYTAGMLVAVLPATRFWFYEDWWFLLASGMTVCALTFLLLACKKKSLSYLLLFVLLAQWGFETRLEAVVLWPLFFIVNAAYNFPFKKINRLIVLVFIVNILRIMNMGSGDVSYFGIEKLQQNIATYSSLMSNMLPIMLFSLPAIWFAIKRQTSDIFIILIWMTGSFMLYCLSYTSPSTKEIVLIATPFIILSAISVKHAFENINGFENIIRALTILAALIIYAQSSTVEWQSYEDEMSKFSADINTVIKELPKGVPLVVNPVLQQFAFNKHKALSHPDVFRVTDKSLRTVAKMNRKVACLSAIKGYNLCCFGGMDKWTIDHPNAFDYNCWDAESLGFDIKELASSGDIRLLLLTNPQR